MLIFAHRGASAKAPENTLLAFELALAAQADGIELDIYEVSGEFYVFHDRLLKRLTGKLGVFTRQKPAQIKQLKVFNQAPIPTLWQALELIRGRCLVNVEIKNKINSERLLALLNNAQVLLNFKAEQFIISSFNHSILQTFQQAAYAQAKNYAVGALTASSPVSYAQFATELGAQSVHIDIDVITEQFVQDAHARQLKVLVYTVDYKDDMDWLKKIGVDGIFTNDPEYARTILKPC